ncbi:hypothetical protein NCCP691_32200 [Noviherbaspirillum aridicola]|uniref:O-antigen ligase-related domain-containing protein n=2 Tax=Noviherbaspirillum aridicola TaxID=2849687 RepID=A0ABQ4Q7K5_9BURK|nr:hypothetical protein NCCP691_32200 [Noviherbaspirillum aridicola]
MLQTSTTPHPGHFIPGFDNFRFFNHAQTVSLPSLILLVALAERSSGAYRLWFAVASVWWALIFVTGARGTVLGVLAGLMTVVATRKGDSRRWVSELLRTGLVGVVLYCVFFLAVPAVLGRGHWDQISSVINRSVTHPVSDRGRIWWLAVEMISDSPLLGAGPAHFAHAAPKVDFGAHPHNWVLQIGAEWGLIALLALCVAVALAFRALLGSAAKIDSSDRANHSMLCAWISIGVGILADGLVSGLIVMPVSQLWIALYLGLAWGWTATRHNAYREAAPPAQGWLPGCAFVGLILLSIALYLLGVFPEVKNLQQHEEETFTPAMYPNGVLRPRIWSAGHF